MKKQKSKKPKSQKKNNLPKKAGTAPESAQQAAQAKVPAKQAPRRTQKKAVAKKSSEGRSVGKYVTKAGQFLREAKIELKKVKWPTRKELLASTAVVIVLTLFVAFYLGLVDFGLIKLIKVIVG